VSASLAEEHRRNDPVHPVTLNSIAMEKSRITSVSGATLWFPSVTVRKTINTVIATYCIESELPLLYGDRDFEPFVERLGLRSAPSRT
jgi:hypothetical protein